MTLIVRYIFSKNSALTHLAKLAGDNLHNSADIEIAAMTGREKWRISDRVIFIKVTFNRSMLFLTPHKCKRCSALKVKIREKGTILMRNSMTHNH